MRYPLFKRQSVIKSKIIAAMEDKYKVEVSLTGAYQNTVVLPVTTGELDALLTASGGADKVKIKSINSYFEIPEDIDLAELNGLLNAVYEKEPDAPVILDILTKKETSFKEACDLILSGKVEFQLDISDETDLGRFVSKSMTPEQLDSYMKPVYSALGDEAVKNGWVIDNYNHIAIKVNKEAADGNSK